MNAANQQEIMAAAQKKEIMLQVNQRLFERGMISEDVYKEAKQKIVSGT